MAKQGEETEEAESTTETEEQEGSAGAEEEDQAFPERRKEEWLQLLQEDLGVKIIDHE